MFTDPSDYVVEQYIKPTKVRKRLINDERADILGNFDDDDNKFKKKMKKSNPILLSEENPFADADNSDDDEVEADIENDDENEEDEENEESDDQDETSNNDEQSEINDHVQNSDENAASEPEPSELKEVPKKANKTKKPAVKIQSKSTTNKDLTDDQVQALIRGASKKDRYVLYVTNINYSTTREILAEFFSVAGDVKSVRVPKVRRSAFAFVEMSDINGFRVC